MHRDESANSLFHTVYAFADFAIWLTVIEMAAELCSE
jgi:hypothetical protein